MLTHQCLLYYRHHDDRRHEEYDRRPRSRSPDRREHRREDYRREEKYYDERYKHRGKYFYKKIREITAEYFVKKKLC